MDGPVDGSAGCYLDATGSEMLDEYESAAVGTLHGGPGSYYVVHGSLVF